MNIDNCVDHLCQHGGKCVDGIDSYSCDCRGTGFTGRLCQVAGNQCGSRPCRNNGTCVEGDDAFTCDCAGTGYRGDLCEVDVDECRVGSHECAAGSVCVNTPGGYRCSCDSQKTGTS